MDIETINLAAKFSLFSEHWSPKIIAKMNDYHFKLVKITGEFIWHDHPETDEVLASQVRRVDLVEVAHHLGLGHPWDGGQIDDGSPTGHRQALGVVRRRARHVPHERIHSTALMPWSRRCRRGPS